MSHIADDRIGCIQASRNILETVCLAEDPLGSVDAYRMTVSWALQGRRKLGIGPENVMVPFSYAVMSFLYTAYILVRQSILTFSDRRDGWYLTRINFVQILTCRTGYDAPIL